MHEWYKKYKDLPYEHLGLDPQKGIDCFNLIRYIYLKERNIEIPYTSRNFCNVPYEAWYFGIVDRPFKHFNDPQFGWKKVDIKVTEKQEPQLFDAITIILGSSNCANHCALYVGNNKIIHTMKTWGQSKDSPYGTYYRQYTEGVFRWVGIPK